MKTCDKIMDYRKRRGYTLEQLGKLVGVNGLTIDKWEAGLEYPDAEQLKKLGEIFGCGYEKLLSDPEEQQEPEPEWGFEWTSRCHFFGMPLVHINLRPLRKAEGIIAIGFFAKGIVSVGVLSMGVISAGLLSLGLLAAGFITMGLYAVTTGIGLSLFDVFWPWIETAWAFLTAGISINPYD